MDPLLFTRNKMNDSLAYEPELRQLFNTPESLTAVFNEDFERQCQTLLQAVWERVYGR